MESVRRARAAPSSRAESSAAPNALARSSSLDARSSYLLVSVDTYKSNYVSEQ